MTYVHCTNMYFYQLQIQLEHPPVQGTARITEVKVITDTTQDD